MCCLIYGLKYFVLIFDHFSLSNHGSDIKHMQENLQPFKQSKNRFINVRGRCHRRAEFKLQSMHKSTKDTYLSFTPSKCRLKSRIDGALLPWVETSRKKRKTMNSRNLEKGNEKLFKRMNGNSQIIKSRNLKCWDRLLPVRIQYSRMNLI